MEIAAAASLLQHPSRRARLVMDAQGRVLAGNERARGSLFTPALTAELRPTLEAAMAQLRESPGRTIHHRHVTGDGRPLDCRLLAIVDADGAVIGFTCSVSDTSEAPDLVEPPDRARWRFALESAQDGLWDWSAESGRVYRSSRCFTMLGYPRQHVGEELDDWRALVHPDDRARVAEALQDHLTGRRPQYQTEYRVRDAAGEWRWILDRGRVVAWRPDGRPARVSGTHTDISPYKRIETQLREHDVLLQEAQRIGRIGSWAWDPVSDTVWWSAELYRIAGREPSLPAPTFAEQRALFTPASMQALERCVRRALADGTRYSLPMTLVRPDGEPREVEVTGELLSGTADGTTRLVGVVHDVTEQRQAEATSRWRNDLLNRIAAMGRIGGFELLSSGEVHFTDESHRIHGLEPGTPLQLQDVLALYDEPSRARILDHLRLLVERRVDDTAFEVSLAPPDGRARRLRVTGTIERGAEGVYRVTGLVQDITEEFEANERIEQLAHFDTLTGLPNRFLFRRRAEDAIAQIRHGEPPIALLFLDLDRFKDVNDTQGHEAGDRLLQAIAGRLRACVRGSDLVGRLGGDEFLVLLRDVERPEDAAVVARKIIAAIAEPVTLAHGDAKIGCSIGIALHGPGNADLEALLRAADTAMYAAKDAGRNTFEFYDDSFFRKVQRRVKLEQELRQALAGGELSLVYQPGLCLADDTVSGIEALLRWTGPDGTARSPVEFIPIAEDSGEIVAIGRWVLGEACAQARRWHEQGLEFGRIAVNVSAVQLRDPQFADEVLAICATHGWPTDRLELELTESALMRDTDVLRRTFDLFAANAVTLAVDDFGTGFSNLGYLHRFPVRHLKIDRAFVQRMHVAPRMLGLTQAVVSLGHSLGMAVVAEGVEDAATLALLRAQGCDQAQGYLIARPLPANELEAWLRERAAIPAGTSPR